VIGRGREVHDHLGAGKGLGHRRGARLPDVLADGEAQGDAIQLEHARLGARLEVALLVEHAVVGQEHLAVDGRHLAVHEHRRAVVDVLGALGKPDQGGYSAGVRRELLQRRGGGVEEVGLEQKVLGRVARERELREDHQRRALLARAGDPVGDPRRVAADVADGGIDLGEGHAQGLCHAQIMLVAVLHLAKAPLRSLYRGPMTPRDAGASLSPVP
jgi:hypothetical protein